MRLRGLRFRYPGRAGFRLGPIDVEGPDDRPWLILGRSGAGKSTLLRVLAGSFRPEAGSIETAPPGGERAYLPQLPERVLAGRNLAEDLCGNPAPGREERSRLRNLLVGLGLEGISLGRRSGGLSAGERRRAALGVLVASGTRGWALDEPDAGLDRGAMERVLGVLRSHLETNPGRLWIATHRFERFLGLGPWLLVLDGGKVAATGAPGEVLGNPDVSDFLETSGRAAPRLWAEVGKRCPRRVGGGLFEEAGARGRAETLRSVLRQRAGLS